MNRLEIRGFRRCEDELVTNPMNRSGLGGEGVTWRDLDVTLKAPRRGSDGN